ncbi:unnamed protein product [Rotaria sordida]|uniref:Uncharacterized protein n=1 Tax=Rotaria sordida TaxID=392033 RepID=A0A814HSP2_9BILA|nr:unnamed protein product [Rotaria sordida]CAF1014864.1 unnamed protein product [Rotaria sordida]CAF1180747.1 unnamed protein product [Rotaria sordida]CAF1198979.1 unnamed protein product [Rotaria sordida]CAF1206583.1 unnamed protein product [Rotaria sordida]
MEELITTIGIGTFSRVILARRYTDEYEEYHALKIMAIRDIIQMKQVNHINDERTILDNIKHSFIVHFYGSYRDSRYLYLSMEFLPGGELFSYFRQVGRFKGSIVRFYACEIILALEYLHSLSIVYRDLKLENLVLDITGHVKLTDFGFAKYVQDRTFTVCGTPEYLAPEMILASGGHSFGVDWYALGILIYELLIGRTPFASTNHQNHPSFIFIKILHAPIPWPSQHGIINRLVRNLIQKLLERDRTRRLGCMAAGVNDIKKHPWFKHIVWIDIMERQIQPPIIPTVDYPGDTQNFELFEDELLQAPECTKEEYDLFDEF